MHREAREAPEVVRAQLMRNGSAMQRLGGALRDKPPRAVVTLARGSSDHAATYAKHLIETRAGVLTASATPSTTSVYGARQDLRDCLCLVISQSGRSPDLLEASRAAADAGARVVALVNDEASPLAGLAHHTVPLCAGVEESVAATKSWLGALSAIAHLVAEWRQDPALLAALQQAPEGMRRAWDWDWSAAMPLLADTEDLYVIGRGPGLGLAQEAALKCKETCGLHAEAFSAAEVRHGPQALLGAAFPALLFAQDDETRDGIESLARDLVARGVPVLLVGAAVRGTVSLPSESVDAPIAPLLMGVRFYRLANALAIARGFDPDHPPHLRKVTETR